MRISDWSSDVCSSDLASANPVLETFWSTISILASGEHHGLSYTANNRAHIVKAHRRILDACRRRQPDEAVREMTEHLGELDHHIKTRYQHIVGEPMKIAFRPGRRIGRGDTPDTTLQHTTPHETTYWKEDVRKSTYR